MKRIAALLALLPVSAFALVNVNTAQQSELQSTRGLDKLAAKRIIEYRNEHGPYGSLDDLAKVIGADTTQRISEHVRFDGDAYDGPPKPAKKKPRRAPPREAPAED